MKKIFCVLACGFFALCLAGCGKDSTSKLTCTKTSTEDGMTTAEKFNMTFKNDKPATAEMIMDMKFGDDSKQFIDATYSMLESSFKEAEQEGLKITTSKKDESIEVKMDIDFSKVKSTDELDLSIDANENKDSVKKDFEKDGYECK